MPVRPSKVTARDFGINEERNAASKKLGILICLYKRRARGLPCLCVPGARTYGPTDCPYLGV